MTFLETYQLIKENPDTLQYKGVMHRFSNSKAHTCFINEDMYFVALKTEKYMLHSELRRYFDKYLSYLKELKKLEESEEKNYVMVGDEKVEVPSEKAADIDLEIAELMEKVAVDPSDLDTLERNFAITFESKGRLYDLGDVKIFTYWDGNDDAKKSIVSAKPFHKMLDVLNIDPKDVLVELSELEEKDNIFNTTMVPLSEINKDHKKASEEDQEKSKRIQELMSQLHLTTDKSLKKRIIAELETLGVNINTDKTMKIKDPLYWNQYSRMSESIEVKY